MSQTYNVTPLSGREPQLSGDDPPRLTGMEPLLGGFQRVVDTSRIQVLLDASSEQEREAALEQITRFGQAGIYAGELAQVIPERARQKTNNWRGRFTTGQRCRAIAALAVIGSNESIPPLLDALNDSIHPVREGASAALTAICERLPPEDPRTKATYRIMTGALRTLPVGARKVVARILAQAPPELVLGPLLCDGLTAEEWGARREAAWVLGMLGDPRATKRLVSALSDPSAAVRASAAWALGRLEAPGVIKPLHLAMHDDDEVVRAMAVEALGTHAARLPTFDRDFRPTLDLLVVALYDEDLSVRQAAWEALSAIDAADARLALHEYSQSRRNAS